MAKFKYLKNVPANIEAGSDDEKALLAIEEMITQALSAAAEDKNAIIEQVLEQVKAMIPEKLEEQFTEIAEAVKKQGAAITALKSKAHARTNNLQGYLKNSKQIADLKSGALKQLVLNLDVDPMKREAVNPIGTGMQLSLIDAQGELYDLNRWEGDSILDLCDTGTANTAAIPYVEELPSTGDVEEVDENGSKPDVVREWQEKHSNAIKVAGITKVTNEMLSDIAFVSSEIESTMSKDIENKRERTILAFARSVAPAYSLAAFNGSVPGASMRDVINVAITQSQSKGGVPTAIVMNPIDAGRLRLVKDANNRPILNIFNEGRYVDIVEGLRLVISNNMPVDEFVLGDWKHLKYRHYQTALIWDREGLDLRQNRMTMVMEERFHRWIPANRLDTFVKGNFKTIQEQINKA